MTLRVILRIVAFGAVIVAIQAARVQRRSSGPTEFNLEEPCAEVGGICLLNEECSEDIPQEYLGLCPDQRNEGAECCHGYSIKEHRCQRLGGECFPNSEECPENFQITRATDCEAEETCCLLV